MQQLELSKNFLDSYILIGFETMKEYAKFVAKYFPTIADQKAYIMLGGVKEDLIHHKRTKDYLQRLEEPWQPHKYKIYSRPDIEEIGFYFFVIEPAKSLESACMVIDDPEYVLILRKPNE